jgi:DNA topoisomerase-1
VADGEKCPLCGGKMLRRRSRFGEYLACANYPECKGKKNLNGAVAAPPQETSEVCEKCGKPMVIRSGKRGRFMACSGYPACKNTYSIDGEGKKVAGTGPLDSGRKCEKCGKPMVLRSSAKGKFLGCSGYPKCKTIVNVTPDEVAEIEKLNGKK